MISLSSDGSFIQFGKAKEPCFFFICQDWPEQARKTPYAIHSKFVGVKRRITYFLTKWVVFFHVYLDIFLCFFFLLEKFTLFQMSFYSISNHGEKKNTSGKKNSFFIHSIDFTQKGVENDLFRGKKKRYLWSDSFFNFFLCCPLPYSLPSGSSAQTLRRGRQPEL